MNCIAFMTYGDPAAAIDWLERALGFERSSVHEDPQGRIAHAELRFGDGMVMLGPSGPNDFGLKTARELGAASQGVYLVVDDIDACFARVTAAGAAILRPLADSDYGSREFMARDSEGNLWSVGTYEPG